MNFCARTLYWGLKMQLPEIQKLKSNIWITERCHMRAEKRKRFLEHYFHVTLALYALSSIAISVFQGSSATASLPSIMTFTTICTLSISLLIFGFRFGESAAQHRTCYLELQKLRLEQDDERQQITYINILGHYPNHSSADYMAVVVSNIFLTQQRLTDSNGDQIELSAFDRLTYFSYWALIRIAGLAFFISPLLLALYALDAFSPCSLWKPSSQ